MVNIRDKNGLWFSGKPGLPHEILDLLKRFLPQGQSKIPLHEPSFSDKEMSYVAECINSTFVSSVGEFVDKFETMLAELTGAKRVVAVSNGTAALHISLLLSGVEQGDEVLAPALTFVATPNAVSYLGAVPHFVDSDTVTLGVNGEKLGDYLAEIGQVKGEACYNKKTGRRIRALIAVHTYGHPVDLDMLLETCRRFKIHLVEDAAESLGSLYKGVHTGRFGRLSALSFNGNKIITTGGGGAIMTDDEELGELAKHITTTAKLPHEWSFFHDRVGYNYRMPNINAALGCAQLEKLPSFIEKKRDIANRYEEAFSGLDEVTFFSEPDFAKSNYWLNVILLKGNLQRQSAWSNSGTCSNEELLQVRDSILTLTNSNGIMTRPAWNLMHKLPMYRDCPRMDLSVAENLEARLINIPSSVSLWNQN